MRLDVYLVDRGYCNSRNKAKDLLLNEGVRVNGKVLTKPSFVVGDDDFVEIIEEAVMPYVSMGGLKLEKAIRTFDLDFHDKYVIDIGSSTGGFTDCALKHGARFVWAIDVGTGQLVDVLREDSRVKSIENTDFRKLNFEDIGSKVDFVVGDLSFISLKHIAEHVAKFLENGGSVMLLIKPQFEVGPDNVGKGGIVKNPKHHLVAIHEVASCFRDVGLFLNKLTQVPLVSSKKNIEYLALFRMSKDCFIDIEAVVKDAFKEAGLL